MKNSYFFLKNHTYMLTSPLFVALLLYFFNSLGGWLVLVMTFVFSSLQSWRDTAILLRQDRLCVLLVSESDRLYLHWVNVNDIADDSVFLDKTWESVLQRNLYWENQQNPNCILSRESFFFWEWPRSDISIATSHIPWNCSPPSIILPKRIKLRWMRLKL